MEVDGIGLVEQVGLENDRPVGAVRNKREATAAAKTAVAPEGLKLYLAFRRLAMPPIARRPAPRRPNEIGSGTPGASELYDRLSNSNA